MIKFYETKRGWKWVVKAANGEVVDRADEPFSSRAKALRAFHTKARILRRVSGLLKMRKPKK